MSTPRTPATRPEPLGVPLRPLAGLVDDVERFADEVWGRHPGHFAHRAPGSAAPFTLADVDRIVSTSVRVPSIRLVRDGERIPPSRFCSPVRIGATTLHDVADARKVLDEHRRGATIVLQSLQRTVRPLAEWCADLEDDLGWPVQCNAYLTPCDERGLRPHADEHDVFVVQLFGSKRWDVDGLGVLPLSAGEVLYVPRGVRHSARTTERSSLHLTVGVHRPSAGRIVRSALGSTTLDAPTVPLGTDASVSDAVDAALRAAGEALAAVGSHDVASGLRRRSERPPWGALAEHARRRPIDDTTTLVPVPHRDLRLDEVDGRLRCRWHGGELWMPVEVGPAVRAILDAADDPSHELRAAELPELSERSRRVLVTRLADEGLVRTSADLPW